MFAHEVPEFLSLCPAAVSAAWMVLAYEMKIIRESRFWSAVTNYGMWNVLEAQEASYSHCAVNAVNSANGLLTALEEGCGLAAGEAGAAEAEGGAGKKAEEKVGAQAGSDSSDRVCDKDLGAGSIFGSELLAQFPGLDLSRPEFRDRRALAHGIRTYRKLMNPLPPRFSSAGDGEEERGEAAAASPTEPEHLRGLGYPRGNKEVLRLVHTCRAWAGERAAAAREGARAEEADENVLLEKCAAQTLYANRPPDAANPFLSNVERQLYENRVKDFYKDQVCFA